MQWLLPELNRKSGTAELPKRDNRYKIADAMKPLPAVTKHA